MSLRAGRFPGNIRSGMHFEWKAYGILEKQPGWLFRADWMWYNILLEETSEVKPCGA
jgi:hypothetical protein